MCLALLALHAHPRFAVVIAANRDEYHARPAYSSHWWDEGWLGGRDLTAGGTWLGMTRQGRWALVTNVREPGRNDPLAPSRGQLVPRFLQSEGSPHDSMQAIVDEARHYNGFNLLAGDVRTACWGSNRGPNAQALAAGIYGLSNQQLDTSWPKVQWSKDALSEWCMTSRNGAASIEPLFTVLADRTIAPDTALPATGISLERERLLSAPFIVSAGYGTRNSTVITLGYDGHAHWVERTFDPGGAQTGESEFRFAMEHRGVVHEGVGALIERQR